MNSTKIKLPGLNDYFTQEAYNVLRTNIQFCGQDVKVIALTSCGMNEGKTVLSLHVGRSLAELEKSVLVIDADMRKSVMAGRNADVKNAKGLSEVLTGQQKLEDCIYSTQFDNLNVLFSGQYPPNPVELINGKYFDALIETVKDMYDYVIIDTPPLGMVVDAAVVASKCDSAVFVVGNHNVRYPQAKEVIDLLEKSGCKVLGVVLNNAEQRRRGYYYYRRKKYNKGGYAGNYSYGYGRGYGRSYGKGYGHGYGYYAPKAKPEAEGGGTAKTKNEAAERKTSKKKGLHLTESSKK